MKTPSTLIVFTRYPVPGHTKTRLAGVLGDDGAARLHRRLAEHAILQARAAANHQGLQLEIHHTGDQTAMASWLGKDLMYRPQNPGDLGQRMASALGTTSSPSVIMGTDCPDLDETLLAAAFDSLQNHDLVLGPAEDGGYYLIGMNRLHPDLFEGIEWGSDQVLNRTITAAEKQHLCIALLQTLADIDRPDDLKRIPRFLHPESRQS